MACAIVSPDAVAAPSAPTGLTGIALDSRVALSWQPVAGADSYAVYRGTSPTTVTTAIIGGGVPPGGLNPPTTLVDTTAANGTTYYYAVRAVAAGIESPNSLIVQATPIARGCGSGNEVTLENCYPGTNAWGITGPGGIEGFATEQSIERGGSVGLKVNSSATFDVEVYRSGWYGGQRGRLMSIMRNVPASPQPACVTTASTGLTDCSNWSRSAMLTTSTSWPSGVYLLKIIRRDTNADNHILVVVRDDAGAADVLYGVPFTTYQAYNNYGGKSLYDFNSTGANTVSNGTRAVKVSFDRPYAITKAPTIDDWYSRSDSGWVGWLERSGYNVSYTSVTELEHHGSRLLNHRIFLSGTHDEYYSAAMRNALQAARDGRTNLLFGGANELFQKIRFEPSPVTGIADRVEITYKTSNGGPPDPSGIGTTTWRDPAGANAPENALAGQQYIGDHYGPNAYSGMDVSAAQGKDRIWRFTGLENQSPGASTRIGTNLYGWEWDARANNGQEPAGVTTLATGNVNGNILQDAGRTYVFGSATASTVKYTAPSGALVFSAGTNHWNWGLAPTLFGDGAPDARIQQATTNILFDMGALPGTPAAGIRLDDPSAPPTVIGRAPAPGETGVGASSPASASFSRAMDPATIGSSTFQLKGPDGTAVPATVSYDATSFIATLRPVSALASQTTYTAHLAATIKAANGIALGNAVNWSFTTAAPDTTAPSVSITAPQEDDAVSGTVSIQATAADSVGIAGVTFKVDGTTIGSEDTSSPYSVAWDTSAVAVGAHTVTAVARDTAGNTSTATVHVTVDRGLIAAYGFEEPSGTTVSDRSGKGNTGTIVNATRTASGRHGAALSFNGTNAMVTVPDAASLDLTTGMTVEAWVNPAAAMGTSWRTVVLKERTNALSYGMYANTSTSRPSIHVDSGAEDDTRGTTAVAAGTWTHLAGTYDGTTLRMYVNGTQVSSKAVTGAMIASTGALRIGANTIWGEWFSGLIDEVRVYRRALSAGEITTDMNTAVQTPVVDTTPPAQTTGLTASAGVGQAQLSWNAASDDVGVAKYHVYRSTTSGFTPAAGNRITQVTGLSHTDAGLAANTYYYRVAAEDAAGHVGPPSSQVTAVVTADTTAPAVSVTAPAAGSTVSGTVNLAAAATDNVGVVGVQFRVDGEAVGAEDTGAPYQTSWDTTTTSAGTHTITALARDAAGNATTSASVTVTVDNSAPPPPSGLVAAYGFEENSGSTVTDSSGKGNTGTLASVTRSTSGRFGSALTFNGSSSMVSIPDAASLDLTTAMTLEAWVNPAALGTSWRTVLLKEQVGDLVYALYGNVDTAQPGGFIVGGGAERGVRAGTTLPIGSWSHLAATFDGSTLRLYVNGTQVGSTPFTGTITTSTGALRIGGNTIWGEWFNGRIDEVRVYDRALTAAQLTADMNAAVAPQTPDTQAPSTPTGLSANGSLGQAALSWTASTDDVGVVRYDVHRSTTSGFTPSAVNRIAQVAGTSYTDAGLAANTYHYRVIAVDGAGNTSAASAQATATVTADTVAPSVAVTAPAAGSTVSGSAVAITANASDNVGVAGVQFRVDGAAQGAEDTSAPYSTTWNTTNVTPGTHTLSAVARDVAGNTTTSSTVTVTVDNTAPPTPAGLVAAYGFEEASGTTVTDASGQGNAGTLSGATRTASGRFGSALTFNGTSSLVTVPASSSLSLTTGVTLEAWVNPAVAMGNNWETVVMKERPSALSYGLYANTANGRPSIHVDPGNETDTRGTTSVAAGTWTHLAGSYDGTTLRMYVNGTQVSSKAVSGAMITSTGVLRIGGNAVWGEYFNGRIDEVRVYQRALSAAEITADMGRAVL